MNLVEFWKQIYGIDAGKAAKVLDDVRSYLYRSNSRKPWVGFKEKRKNGYYES
jgi:hypothetical protein